MLAKHQYLAKHALFCYKEEMLQENSSAVFQLESLGSPRG